MDDGSRITSHEIIVPRTSRYAVLGAAVSEARELWLVCHGYGQLAERFISRFSVIDDGKRMIVAPEALSRFYLSGSSGGYSASDKVGASWMTREGRDAEIVDQVRYLDLVCARVFEGVDRASIRFVALGFSQGTAAISRWTARTATPPDHLILWGGGVPADLLERHGLQGLKRATTTLVAGSSDPVANAERVIEHRKQLDAAGLSYRLVGYEGGHDVEPRPLAELAASFRNSPTDHAPALNR